MRSANLVKVVDRTHHVSRKLIAITPLLLISGIVAQVVLLALAIVLIVPLLIWPKIINGPYQMITKGMARIMARTIVGHRANGRKAGRVSRESVELSSCYRTRPARCLRPGVFSWYAGHMEEAGGGYYYSSSEQEARSMERSQMITSLIDQADMADAEYIRGNMDRDTWTKTLREIDDKLSILGIRFVSRPWEDKRNTQGF